MQANRLLRLAAVLSCVACRSDPTPAASSAPSTVAVTSARASKDTEVLNRVCTSLGCSSGVSLELDLPLAESELSKTRVHACRNGACVEARFSGITFRKSGGRGLPTKPMAGPLNGWSVACIGWKTEHRFWLAVEWEAERWDGPKIDDRYTVTVLDGRGKVITTLDERITKYVENYPNGKECDGTPCVQAVVNKRHAAQ